MPTVTDKPKKYLTERECAEYLSLRPQTLAAWRCTGRVALPFTRVGARVLYPIDGVERHLRENTVARSSR